MAFWGVEVKPGKPFTHKFDASKGRLHVSMASLGFGTATATMKSVLQCNVGYKSPVFLCSLYPESSESLQLNLEFEEVDEVIFSVLGPRSIHLSGYYLGSGRVRSLNEESESYGEDIADTDSQRSCNSDEEKYDDSFINDGEPEVFPPSPASTDEDENWENRMPQKVKRDRKRKVRKTYQVSESESEECSMPQKNKNGKSAVPGLESEDEDHCPISTFFKNGTIAKKDLHNGGKNAEELMDATSKRNTVDDSAVDAQPIRNTHKDGVTSRKKRKERSKSDKVKQDETGRREAKSDSNTEDQQMSKITDDSELAHRNDLRPKKKRRESKSDKGDSDFNSSKLINDVKDKENKEDKSEAKEVKESEEKKVKKKKKKKIEQGQQVNGEDFKDTETPQLVVEENNNSKVRTLQNGLVIEELESGEQEGKVSVSGKKISVRYVAKLKNTGQVVDSNDLFKFRLGARKVIEAWEVGLEGMRVGEKRKLTIPPLMGYGSEGDGKNIPPDSWLVYEIELVKVR